MKQKEKGEEDLQKINMERIVWRSIKLYHLVSKTYKTLSGMAQEPSLCGNCTRCPFSTKYKKKKSQWHGSCEVLWCHPTLCHLVLLGVCFLLGAQSQTEEDAGKDLIAENWKEGRRQCGKRREKRHQDHWKLFLQHHYWVWRRAKQSQEYKLGQYDWQLVFWLNGDHNLIFYALKLVLNSLVCIWC